MSVDYSIAAIPTVYKGRRYRSRLEARWAAFFDLLGFRHEYEPYDLGVWSPDFLLTDIATLVEVKPIKEFDQNVWDKATAACRKKKLFDGEDAAIHGTLLTNVAPSIKEPMTHVGWFTMGHDDMKPVNAYLAWLPDYETPKFNPAIVSIDAGGWYSACGDADEWDGPYFRRPQHFPSHTAQLWAQASNMVQWQGPST